MFHGLCAFPLTPLYREEADYPGLERMITRATLGQVDSIAVLGSTGNYMYLSREERRRTVETAVGTANGTPVIAGVGGVRTRDVLGSAEDAQRAGASALLLAPVSYQPLTEAEVFGLYSDVCANSSIPIVVYDNPVTTRFSFSDELLGRIGQLPQIASIKTSPPSPRTAAERIVNLRNLLPGHTTLGISGDAVVKEHLRAGYDVWYSVIAGIFPEVARAIHDESQDADNHDAGDTFDRLKPIWSLFIRYGSLRVMACMAQNLGLVDAELLPRPLQPLPAAARAEVGEALRLSGLAA